MLLFTILAGCSPKVKETNSAGNSNPGKSTGKDTFNIGLAISMSGGTALFGEGVKRGVDLAIKEFNDAGGYEGKKAKVVLYDDEAKPEKSIEIVQKLINQDKIVALVGPANSGNAMAHIPFVQEAKIPEVVPVATGTKITQEFKDEDKNYIFRVAAYDGVQVSAI